MCIMCIKLQACSVVLEVHVERQSDTLGFNTINWCQALGVIWITHTQAHTQRHTIGCLDAD